MSTLIAVGRLGKDAETANTQSGTYRVSFDIAEDIGFGDNKKTQWIRCTGFGDRWKKVAQYLTKATLVEVVGQPEARAWKDNSGEPRANLQMIISELKLHGGGNRENSGGGGEQQQRRDPKPQQQRDLDDDIPF